MYAVANRSVLDFLELVPTSDELLGSVTNAFGTIGFDLGDYVDEQAYEDLDACLSVDEIQLPASIARMPNEQIEHWLTTDQGTGLVLVLAANLFSDLVRDAFDPRSAMGRSGT